MPLPRFCLLLVTLVWLGPAHACSCIMDEPSGFLYPEKTLLPSNAKGMLFAIGRDKRVAPWQFVVHAAGRNERLRATVAAIGIPKHHPLAPHLWGAERLRRVGIEGGFRPGQTYTITFREPARGGRSHVSRVSFAIANEPFDLDTVQAAVALTAPLQRSMESFPESGMCSVGLPSLVQTFSVTARGAHSAFINGLTSASEASADGGKFEPVRHVPDICASPPVTQSLQQTPQNRVLWPGCQPPRRIQLRAWLGMLEVDERVIATAPTAADWTHLPPGSCSLLGRLREAMDRNELSAAQGIACDLSSARHVHPTEHGPSAHQWRQLLAADSAGSMQCGLSALNWFLKTSPTPDSREVSVYACALGQRLLARKTDALGVAAEVEVIRDMRDSHRREGLSMGPLPETGLLPLLDAVIQSTDSGSESVEAAGAALASVAANDGAAGGVEERIRLYTLAPERKNQLVAQFHAALHALREKRARRGDQKAPDRP